MTTIAKGAGSGPAADDASKPCTVAVDNHDGINSVVMIGGELDMATAPQLDEALSQLCHPGSHHHTTLDCSGLTFCDSAGLAVLIRAHQQHQRCGGRLTLTASPFVLQRLLTLTGLETFLDTAAVAPDTPAV